MGEAAVRQFVFNVKRQSSTISGLENRQYVRLALLYQDLHFAIHRVWSVEANRAPGVVEPAEDAVCCFVAESGASEQPPSEVRLRKQRLGKRGIQGSFV